jgi:hypothetical protein
LPSEIKKLVALLLVLLGPTSHFTLYTYYNYYYYYYYYTTYGH